MVLGFLHEPPKKYIIGDVQTSEQHVIKLLSGRVLQWQVFDPEPALVQQFKSTVSAADENVDRDKVFLRCPVKVLPSVAEYLLNLSDNPRISKPGRGSLDVRFESLEAHKSALRAMVNHRTMFESKPVEGSWRAVRAEFDKAMKPAAHKRPSRIQYAVNQVVGALRSLG
jgi:hypothetical protein